MGTKFSVDRSFGSINFQLEHPKYVAGDQVNGWVHLSLVKHFPSTRLYLIFTGKEKVKFAKRKSNIANDTGTSKVHIYRDAIEFYSHSFPLFVWPDGTYFPVGQYSFPFSFKLGDNIPGSFLHTFQEHGISCYGKITYKLKAGFKDQTEKIMLFDKITFVVDQSWNLSSWPQIRHYSQKLNGYCTGDLGELNLTCQFDRDKFIVGDHASLTAEIDNRKTRSDV